MPVSERVKATWPPRIMTNSPHLSPRTRIAIGPLSDSGEVTAPSLTARINEAAMPNGRGVTPISLSPAAVQSERSGASTSLRMAKASARRWPSGSGVGKTK